MRLDGPYRYRVSVKSDGGYSVQAESGAKNFVAPVTRRGPKLYTFSQDGVSTDSGQAQGMAARMRLGFQADGSTGYYGYSWRHVFSQIDLHVWCLDGAPEEEEWRALECIEAELVYAYRARHDQWPESQTEIHFHPTSDIHRRLADEAYSAISGATAQQSHATDARTSRG